MPAASEIIDSPLPHISGSQAAAGAYEQLQPSSISTANSPLPKTIIYFPPGTFQQCFLSPSLQHALASTAVQYIETEGGHNLLNEGDVERASALYLLHTVNITLGKGLIPYLNTRYHQNLQFQCLGQYTVGNSRPDIVYKVNGQMVLIVEYKRTNSFHDVDWTGQALVNPPHRNAEQIVQGIPRGTRTALLNNAVVLSQQGNKYSRYCGLIVFFNYQNMIILDYSPNGSRYNDRTNPVNYYFFNERQGHFTHRKLLLSALIYVMRKAGLMGGAA